MGLLQRRSVPGGTISHTADAGHNLDFSTSGSVSPGREVHDTSKSLSYSKRRVPGGNYFGTGHVASTSGYLTPGPGAYDTSKRKERVRGGAMPTTGHALDLASE